MNRSDNSQNKRELYKNLGISDSSMYEDIPTHTYEGSGIQFVPPRRKYIQQNKFGSAYFLDNNEEQYVIQRAFKANNFTSLRDLPDNIFRNCILDDRKERVKQQVYQQTIKRGRTPLQSQQIRNTKISQFKKTKIGTLGYFQLFPYQQSDYELPKKLAAQERQQNVKKREKINEKDFRPAGFDRKMKYEDPFRYIDRQDIDPSSRDNSNYIFPFHLPEDVYDCYRQSQKRQKIIENELKIAGEFYPSKAAQSLTTVNKGKMPQILDQIEFYFKKFLKDKYGYFIGVNKRDHIEIMFESQYIDEPRIQMAMSGMLEHQILSKFALRRNFERWGTISQKNKYLEFVILPPWVKDPKEKLKASSESFVSTQGKSEKKSP